jgi:hypothetical protein
MNESQISKTSYKEIKIKFKHLIDYYLTSGSDFGKILRSSDPENIYGVLLSQQAGNGANRQRLLEEADGQDGFNEKLLKVMCLNQAISKLQLDLGHLTQTRDQLISIMEDSIES